MSELPDDIEIPDNCQWVFAIHDQVNDRWIIYDQTYVDMQLIPLAVFNDQAEAYEFVHSVNQLLEIQRKMLS